MYRQRGRGYSVLTGRSDRPDCRTPMAYLQLPASRLTFPMRTARNFGFALYGNGDYKYPTPRNSPATLTLSCMIQRVVQFWGENIDYDHGCSAGTFEFVDPRGILTYWPHYSSTHTAKHQALLSISSVVLHVYHSFFYQARLMLPSCLYYLLSLSG